MTSATTTKKPRIKTNYLTNKEAAVEIWRSKLSYCYHAEPWPQRVLHCMFDYSGDDFNPVGLTRRFTYDHIPPAPPKVKGSGQRRSRNNPNHIKVNFPPFIIYQDGKEIGRSHWTGGFDDGHFTLTKGRMTDKLAKQCWGMTERIGRKGKFSGYTYLDEMKSNAILQLMDGALQYNDHRSANAFAYLTTIVMNAFRRVLNDEKKVGQGKDNYRIANGLTPSFSHDINSSCQSNATQSKKKRADSSASNPRSSFSASAEQDRVKPSVSLT